MFGVLGWILFGLVVGVIAKLLMPGRDPGGFIITVLLGFLLLTVSALRHCRHRKAQRQNRHK